MDMKKLFGTNKRAETEGRKMYLTADKSVWLLIARKTNPLYKARLSKLLQENSVVLNAKGPEAEAIATACFKQACAEYLLLGWSPTGIDLDEKRKDVAYSQEAANELVEMDDFYNAVDAFAGDMSQYREEEVAKEAKN